MPNLYKYLALQGVRTGKLLGVFVQGLPHIQLVSEDLFQVLSYLLLLLNAAVILYGQDHWEPDAAGDRKEKG